MLVSIKYQYESAIGFFPPTWTSLPPLSPSHPSKSGFKEFSVNDNLMAGTQGQGRWTKQSVVLTFGNSTGLFLCWWSGGVVLEIYSLCNRCPGCGCSRCDLCLANITWLDRIRLSHFMNTTLVLPRICMCIFIYQVPLNMGKLTVKLNSLTPIFFYWVIAKRGR